jgi:hypothetical protein
MGRRRTSAGVPWLVASLLVGCGQSTGRADATTDGIGGTGGSSAGTGGLSAGTGGSSAGMAGSGGSGGAFVEPECGAEHDTNGMYLQIMDVEGLRALAGVTVVHGSLDLRGLSELTLLRCLQQVDGSLHVSDPGTGDLTGLEALTTVTKTFQIMGVDSLEGLDGLREVDTLRISSVRGTSLAGLRSLQSVGDMEVTGSAIESMNGLDSLQTVGRTLLIANNLELKTIGSLGSVTEIGGELRLITNNLLADLHGLESLQRIGAGLHLFNARSLTSLDGLDSVVELGKLELESTGVSDLRALSGVTSVPGLLTIRLNAMMSSLEGLHAITHAGSVWVEGDLTSLDGLRSLSTVASGFTCTLPVIEDFTGLASLTSVGTSLILRGGFTTLAGLENLAFTGLLRISETTNLTTLDALSNVTTLEDLVLFSNQSLTSLRGLAGLTTVTGGLAITMNSALPACEAEWLSTHVGSVGGEVSISENTGTGSCAP